MAHLNYSAEAGVSPSGALIPGGNYFDVWVFRDAAEARRGLSAEGSLEYLRSGDRPWRRSSNVDLIAVLPVVRANHGVAAVWHRALLALASLSK